MRVLIIDNNITPADWGARDLRRCVWDLAPEAEIHTRRAPQEDLPDDPRRFDRIIVSGSLTSVLKEAQWIRRLEALIRQSLDNGIPYLGVCYGHQLLARVLAGKEAARVSPTPEYGWTRIERIAPSPIFDGLSDSFYSFSSHFDEVAQAPASALTVARSEGCSIQALQLQGRPAFGIQFHPEKTAEAGDLAIENRRKKGTPRILLHPKQGKRLYDPKVGETIFGNFLRLQK